MGCDIYFYVEVWEGHDPDRWRHVPCPAEVLPKEICDYPHIYESSVREAEWYFPRNYRLFTRLADVRRQPEIPPMCMPRGIPANASRPVREALHDSGVDAHNVSWFSLIELANDPIIPQIAGSEWWNAYLGVLLAQAPKPEYVRCVFWFIS